MASPPKEVSSSKPPAVGRQASTSSTGSDTEDVPAAGRARTSSLNDTRWRTSSFSEPGRIVIVAIDASENAKVSFEWFLENIHRSDDLIVLVHCPEAPRLPTFSFRTGIKVPTDDWKKILDEMRNKTEQLEKDYEYTMVSQKLRYKIRGESMKNPGEGICRIAQEEKANLVVIGTRGLSSVKRAVLGSVSDFVVRNSRVPTLIVPNKK